MSLNDKYRGGDAFYFTDKNGQHFTTDLAGRDFVSKDMVEESPVKFTDAEGTEYRVPSWDVSEFMKNNVAERRKVRAMEEWTNPGNSRGGADNQWVSAFDDVRKKELADRGWKKADATDTSILDTVFSGKMLDGDNWRAPENRGPDGEGDVAKDVAYHAENVGRGVAGAVVSGATGVVKTIGDLATAGGAFAADALGLDGVASGLRETKRAIDEKAGKVLDWTTDNVLGDAFFNEGDGTREMTKAGLKASEEVGGLYGLGKVVGAAGKGVEAVAGAMGKTVGSTEAATGAMAGLMGAQGYEDTISAKEATGKEVTWRDQVAAGINGGVAAAIAPLYGKVAGLLGKEEATRVIQKSYGEMLKRAAVDVAEGAVLGGVQAVGGEAATAVQTGEIQEGAAKRVLTAAAVGGALVGATKVQGALGGWVRENRVNYARAATMQGESALAATRAGMPLDRSRFTTDDVRAVTQNNEVVFQDGTVYVPARVDGSGKTISEPKIVINDGTILNPAGKVIGVRGTKLGYMNEIRGEATTPAEVAYRKFDPEAPFKFRVIDPVTGETVNNNALAGLEAPEGVRAWFEAKRAGTELPELDAEGHAYTALWLQAHSVNPEISRAAQLGLEQVAAGKMDYRSAAEVVDNAIEQTNGWQYSIYGQFKRSGAVKPEAAAGTEAERAAEPVRTDLPALGNAAEAPREGGAIPKATTANAELMLGYVNNGTIAPTEVPTTKILPVGDTLTVAGAANSGTIIVRQNADGSFTAITGGDKIEEAKQSGAKAIKTVVVKEEDGWTDQASQALALVDALKNGAATPAETVKAVAKLGLSEEDLRGITAAVPDAEGVVKTASNLAPAAMDKLDDANLTTIDAVGNTVNVKTVGMDWENVQTKLVETMPTDVDADTASVAGTIAVNAPEMDGVRIWDLAQWASVNAAMPEVNDALNDGPDGIKTLEDLMAKDSAGTVPVEMPNGELETVNQVEAQAPKVERYAETTVQDVAPMVDKSLELVAVPAKDGVFHCAQFPMVELKFENGTQYVSGLTPQMMLDSRNREQMGKLLNEIAIRAEQGGYTVAFEDGALVEIANDLVQNYVETGREKAMAARAKSVGKVLLNGGLANEIVTDAARFEQALSEYPDGVRLAKDGKTWGFYSPRDGKIYLNGSLQGTKLFLNTTIHEFAHPAVIATRDANPELYNRGMELIAETDYYRTVADHPDYAGMSERSKREEALVRLLSERLEDIKAKVPAKIYKEIEEFVTSFWKRFGEANGIADLTPAMVQTMTIEDIADAIGAEMQSGRKFGTKKMPKAEQMELFGSVEKDTDLKPYRAGEIKMFADGQERVYSDVKNGTKLFGPTYDDDGNLIPLSQRFDNRKNDIRLARGPNAARAVFVAGRARAAEPGDQGEQTPGTLAASRELANQAPTPFSMAGQIHRLALPISEMEWLRKKLTGNVTPAHVGRPAGGGIAAASKSGKVVIEADVFGTVDKTDMAKEKQLLVAHGFFRNEDPTWCAGQTPAAIAAERGRSEDQLATQLLNLAKRRNTGLEAGGQGAARGAFAAEVAKIVMDMPDVPASTTIGRVKTIGQGVRDYITAQIQYGGGTAASAEASMRHEAGQFLDWCYGGPIVDPATGATTSRGDQMSLTELTSEMFGKFLIMPEQLEQQAPDWSAAIENAIATNPKLTDAWQQLSIRGLTTQAHAHVAAQIAASQSKDHERALAQLDAERRKPIKAGGFLTDLKEQVVVGMHDTMGPVYIRINEAKKRQIAAKKKLMRTLTPAQRAVVQADIDRFIGQIATDMNKFELARTAWERGAWNEGRRYTIKIMMALNNMTERDGNTIADLSEYDNMQRIIETQGRAGSYGINPRQAQLILGDMARRLGAERWTKLETTDREIHAVMEQEVINDPRFTEMFGQGFADYCRSQTHYVTTKRVFSPEELDAIERARAQMRRLGIAGGDDVISQMYAYGGRMGAAADVGEENWRAVLKGSMAASQEALSATFTKQMALMNAVRRNNFVIQMRQALLDAGVTGVRDMKRVDGAGYPDNRRYGHVNYMEGGQKRVLIVPRQIADGMRMQPSTAGIITDVNSLCRLLYIDYNVAYWNQNINRNNGSIEKNMPGMSEPWIQTIARPVLPGVNKIAMLALEHTIRKLPENVSLPLRLMLGQHTPYYFIPQAKRYADLMTDPSAWQKKLWAAEDAGDIATVTEMQDDFSGVMEMLRGNMFVPSHYAYTAGQTKGFLEDVFDRNGLKLVQTAREEDNARTKFGKVVKAVNVFKKNQAQQEWEDVFAKTKAYLHDRMNFGLQRTTAETGNVVKKNVSIAEGERAGSQKAWIQKFYAQFFNMCEKGNVRHFKAYAERPGETFAKTARTWIGRLIGGLLTSGIIAKIMLDDDEVKGNPKKAAEKYGAAWDYAKFMQRSSQNISKYTKTNAEYQPIWTSPDGYTSIVLAAPLNDEDKVITPTADATVQSIAYAMGIGPAPKWGDAIVNSTIKAVTPDLQASTPIWNLGKTVIASMTDWNPTDQFRQAPMFDKDLHANKFRSLEDAEEFGVAAGMRLWNDFGVRAVIQAPVNGVDNGRGSAPESLEAVLTKIPVLSPAIGRFVKIQVGSPAKRGETVTEDRELNAGAVRLCAKRLLEMSETGIHQSDPKAYEAKIAEWTKTYGLNPFEVMNLRKQYLNGWIQRTNRGAYDQEAIQKLMIEARKQGMDQNDVWLMLGE